MLLRRASIIVIILAIGAVLISCSVPTTEKADIERIVAHLVLEQEIPEDRSRIVVFQDTDHGETCIYDDVWRKPLQQTVRVWGIRDGVIQELDSNEWEHQVARGVKCPDKRIVMEYIRVWSWSSSQATLDVTEVTTLGSCADHTVCYPSWISFAWKVERTGNKWSFTEPDEGDGCNVIGEAMMICENW